MYRRVFGSVLLALALAASQHVTLAARPLYVVCGMTEGLDIFIVVENFGGVGQAVQHCVHFWQGYPKGIVN